jgi:NADH-quinone oxidoreductase subunit C
MPTSLELARQLQSRFRDFVSEPTEFRGEVNLKIALSERILEVMQFAKNELGFEMLLDITGIDHLGAEPRFEIVYHLSSLASHQYLRLKTFVGEESPELPSVVSLWKGADWHEREVYDMMGIRFKGHPDLRRILMWDSYPHFPLRKEFPLAGLPTADRRANSAPMAGGPFVTSPGDKTTVDREPRSKGEARS